jgi:cyclase
MDKIDQLSLPYSTVQCDQKIRSPKHSIRIIPRLDIKGSNLVKGIRLEGLRVLGTPEYYAREYYNQGADELMYQDVVASLYGRSSILEIVSRTAEQISIPLTVGGGIRTLNDISAVLRAGADKVAINTAAIARPELIREAAEAFGSSTIVVAIEAIRQKDGRYLAYTDNGREYTGVEVFNWAEQAASFGAGEILASSVDRDGTGLGFDEDLIRGISTRVTIPVVGHGGAGRPSDLVSAVRAGADAVCMASILHYKISQNIDRLNIVKSGEGNTEFLARQNSSRHIERVNLGDLKKALLEHQIKCRDEM